MPSKLTNEKSSSTSGHIRLEDVSFTYPSRPSIQVLDGLTLDIPAGSFVALVGHSGCGKSTTIQLLERFYDPTSGRVTVDGKDVRDFPVEELRNEMALVSQEPTLYAGTIGFNVRLGSRAGEWATDEEVVRACKEANIVSKDDSAEADDSMTLSCHCRMASRRRSAARGPNCPEVR